MKHYLLKKIFFCCSALLFFAHFGGQNSSTSTCEKPAINVSGTLIDTSDQQYSVENVTIGGRYTDIPVYQIPKTPDVNPDINTTKLDLREIHEIRLASPEVLKFNNRDYLEIEVISNDSRRTKNSYIIDRIKRLQCDEINEAGPIQKELSFLAVKSMVIENARSRQEAISEYKGQMSDKHMVTDMMITKTKALINELEDSAKRLQQENPEESALQKKIMRGLEELKSTFKSWFA